MYDTIVEGEALGDGGGRSLWIRASVSAAMARPEVGSVHGPTILGRGGANKHTSSTRRVLHNLPAQLPNSAPVAITPSGLQALKVRGSFGLPKVSEMTSLLNRNKPTGERDVRCSLGGRGGGGEWNSIGAR